jgi:hypothetical protein
MIVGERAAEQIQNAGVRSATEADFLICSRAARRGVSLLRTEEGR